MTNEKWLVTQAGENFILHLMVIAEAFEPLHVRLVTKPTQLPLRIVTHVELGLFDSTFQIAVAAQEFNHAAVAVRAERI